MTHFIKTVLSAGLLCTALTIGSVSQSAAQSTVGGAKLEHIEVDIAVVAEGWSVLDLVRRNVKNEDDNLIGYVHDIIIAPDSKASYVIVNVAGFLNIAHKLVAIPVESFLDGGKKHLILPGADEKSLGALPKFQYN